MANEVRDLMTKGEKLAVANESATVADVAKVMAVRNVGTVLVTDSNGKLSGVVTDCKIATDLVANNKAPNTLVSEIMTQKPETAKANNPVHRSATHEG